MIRNRLYENCQNFCRNNQYPLVVLKLNEKYNENNFVTISELYNKLSYSDITNEIKSLINQTLCIDNSENNNLKNCVIVIYIKEESKYKCHVCQDGYSLNNETNQCSRLNNMDCKYENIGNKTNPIYSCIKCPQSDNYFHY